MSEYITKCSEGIGINGNRFVVPDYLDTSKEIVRCKDCEFYLPDMYKHFTCEYLQLWAMPDDFCAWAERKERIES